MIFLDFIKNYYGAVSIILTLFGLVWGAVKWTESITAEKKQRRFENYHELIKKLTQSDADGENIKLDRQIAAVYELTNFPEYYPASVRMLEGWLKNRDRQKKEHGRLYTEMKISVQYMKSKFFKRCFKRVPK